MKSKPGFENSFNEIYLSRYFIQGPLFHASNYIHCACFFSSFVCYCDFINPLFQNQYAFIYDALLELVIVGDTEIVVKDLPARIRDLEQINPDTNRSLLLEEFEVCIFQ